MTAAATSGPPDADALPTEGRGIWWSDSRPTGDGHTIDVCFTDALFDVSTPEAGTNAPGRQELSRHCGPTQWMRQVHGRNIARITATGEPPTADAMVTGAHGPALAVRTADCVPVLIADLSTGARAAVHAGRPGVALDVVGAAIAALSADATDFVDPRLVAWIGPHVCGRCYEVPSELREEVAAAEPATWTVTRWKTPGIDLGAGVRAQLQRAGVREIVETGGCTRERSDLHSYRRDGAEAGRLAAVIWRRAAQEDAEGAGHV